MGPPRGPVSFLAAAAAACLLERCLGSSPHSLRYFVTSVSDPGREVPRFFYVGYVDNQQFVSYDPNARRSLPKVPWMTEVDKDDPQYWERNSDNMKNAEQAFRVGLVNVRKYYNQSGGFHTLQRMYGCELRKDGSKGGYFQDAYDGRDYISLDKETLTWTAADVPAQNTKRKWEAEPAFAQGYKAYLEETCIEWLERYLGYGNKTLLRREPPEVKVAHKADDDNMETLICRVGGFYPKEIDISWTKDGKNWMQDTFHGLVSPNSDGTYYTWWSIKIDPKDRERYKCRVEHDGLEKPLDLAWEEPVSASNLGLIITCVVGVVLLVAVIVGTAVYIKKRRDGYKAASTSDQGSNSSGKGSADAIQRA
uniref:MHC class I antigen n=1 Tax=Amblyrhynchus cristatus TaxID=51208 RepID=B3UZY6_AMBCR|nr:MHC class I antigen [Amblyrhynchus cristatus]